MNDTAPLRVLVVEDHGLLRAQIVALLRDLQRHPLPPFAAELGCDSWAQVALKFIVSHPAVSIAIPATSRVDHVQQNLGAARGPMPDAALRARMAAHVAAL
jgi:aryl-alcohol dehydrogenase-like predicted oxidoreductase